MNWLLSLFVDDEWRRSRFKKVCAVLVLVALSLYMNDIAVVWLRTNQAHTKTANRIPNILIAGAQKAGTSWTYHYLQPHEHICTPKFFGSTYPDSSLKEVHFFDHYKRYQKGLSFYQSRWTHCHSRFLMDSTPNYMAHPERIRKVYDEQGTAAQLKIIFVLREPVSREISSYNFQRDLLVQHKETAYERRDLLRFGTIRRRRNSNVRTFEEYIQFRYHRLGLQAYELSLYGSLLERWFQLFDRKQILVLSFDELRTNATSFAQRVTQFLQIDTPLALPTGQESNKSKKWADPPCAAQKPLADVFEPWNEKLYDLLQQNPGPEMEQRPFPKFQNRCHQENN